MPLADQKEKSLAFSSRCFRVEVHHPQWLMELAQQMAHSPMSVYSIEQKWTTTSRCRLRIGVFGEQVADPGPGEQVAWLSGVRFQFVA